MTGYRWVAARKAEGFPTTTAREVARVSASAFYAWVERDAGGPSAREQSDAELVEQRGGAEPTSDGVTRGW